MLEQVCEILATSLDDLTEVELPYVREFCFDQIDDINELIADTRKAISFLKEVTEHQLNEFLDNNFVEGEKILNAVLRMRRQWN